MSRTPQSLRRESTGQWVTLRPASPQEDRFLCVLDEDDSVTCVIRRKFDKGYGTHLRTLMQTPPPDTLGFVRWTWPIDLLVDGQGNVHGYLVEREKKENVTTLAAIIEPERLKVVAPTVTGRHLLLIAKNVAVTIAALHSIGHGRVRGRQILIDQKTRIIFVRADELLANITQEEQIDDERRLGALLHRMLAHQPWAEATIELQTALRRVERGEYTSAQKWFRYIRDAERALPRGSNGDTAIYPG